MEQHYSHHVSGFFPCRKQAERAHARFIELGLPQERVKVLDGASVIQAAVGECNDVADAA